VLLRIIKEYTVNSAYCGCLAACYVVVEHNLTYFDYNLKQSLLRQLSQHRLDLGQLSYNHYGRGCLNLQLAYFLYLILHKLVFQANPWSSSVEGDSTLPLRFPFI